VPIVSAERSAIERRYIDRRGDVGGEHAAKRRRQADRLAGQWREIDPPHEARARFLGRDDLEKLLLPCSAANRGQQIRGGIAPGGFRLQTHCHGQGLITTSLCAGYPSLSAPMRTQPLACASAASDT
jgi:hypothetical protein